MTEVVAALIWKGDRFLACQRPAHKARGLLWEFVGGKVEPGETLQEALVRECHEEMAIAIEVESLFMEVTHTYPDMTVHLSLFNATIAKGEPQLLEHNAFAWITTEEIDSLDFCPADVDILQKLKLVHNRLDACLFSLADPKYQEFQSKLIPNIDSNRMLGVRVPLLRKLAKELAKYTDVPSFLNALPHRHYEEDILHALLINGIGEYTSAVAALERFLPFVDNWGICDTLSPKAFKSHPEALLEQVKYWLKSPHVYTRRFAAGVLMKYYLDAYFSPEHLQLVLEAHREEYYMKMMVAWYFATALAKQYDVTVEILEKHLMDPWTHNKTIQKAIESYRIGNEQKEYLRTLKINQKEGKNYA